MSDAPVSFPNFDQLMESVVAELLQPLPPRQDGSTLLEAADERKKRDLIYKEKSHRLFDWRLGKAPLSETDGRRDSAVFFC